MTKSLIGSKLIHLDTVDSTNLYLQQLIRNSDVEEGTIILANEQTAGRGQRGNKWNSHKGLNLTFSFVVYPVFLKATEQFGISAMVSLAVFDSLCKHSDDVKIKWPNDIYIGKRKVAGILIENVLININQKSFDSDLPNPTSLGIETGKEYNTDSILQDISDKLNYSYHEFIEKGFDRLKMQYIGNLYQLNEYCNYMAGEEKIIAKITGIENDGRLCLLTDKNETLKFAFKEVQFL